MKNDSNCALIRDILPIYNDAATSAESNIIIENHLKECDECKNCLDEIKKNDIKLPNKEDETYRYVQIAKKIKRRKIIKIISVIVLIIFILAITYTVFTPAIVTGDSMSTDIHDGQLVFLNRLAYTFSEPKRFDIVLYKKENSFAMSRIIATPNEKVKIVSGIIFINDETIDFSYLPNNFSLDEFSLKDNQYFIIKDKTEDLNGIPIIIDKNDISGKFYK